ncbi:hypothetical protein F3Y22_tig00110109pilonHSYRG00212 [Hibiscus syriacus]|uniref:Disease resistance R13L4/SHOC-2-like LRR domain-containing protein n=1 Tax=Hibiscus syriacus TaxID=106335 RepID=A0A6A3BLR0_HIBSY|nr:hypothetical protein F3Y22_tig00110109pilonHSYRG00212 [Hibiscus syriacus]
MESRWCAMVLLAFLVLGWCECCLEEERVALSRLKPFFPLIDYTNDVSYYPVEEKETSLNCCEWERVECNPTTGRVIKLFLDAPRDEGPYGLHNRVPWYLNASLFLPFQELKNLSLGGNYIAGCVADQGFERLSSKLKKLEILDLSENYFNDSIFMSLSELSSLKFLDLSYNFPLTGSNHTNGIKMLSRLNNLETLILSRNSLSNNILSQLHGFTSLKSLNLQLCGLEGTVDLLAYDYVPPKENRQNQSKQALGYKQEGIYPSNSRPASAKYHPSKESTSYEDQKSARLHPKPLGRKNILKTSDSEIPAQLHTDHRYDQPEFQIWLTYPFTLKNLKELYLGGNEIESLGSSFQESRLMNLEVLDLRGNRFNNSILSSLGRFPNLRSLSLGGSELKGSIDIKELVGLRSLEEVEIFCWSGCSLLLQSFGSFPSLKTLSLGGFSFNDTMVTSDFPNSSVGSPRGFSSLKHLRLSSCEISQNFTLQVFQLKNLESLDIYLTPLANNFLEKIGAMPSLKFLSIWGCGLNGTLHVQESRLMNLEVIDLRGNLFNNSILSSLGRFPNLRSLSLGGSELKGSIDIKELVGLRSLEEVDIFCYSGCSLLLQSFVSFPSLKTLSLGGFSFNDTMVTSDFPNSSVGSPREFSSLKHLELFECEISQNFTLQAFQLKNLESLDISETPLANNFLEKIGAMPSLKFLSIWGCGLNGTLHVQGFCDLMNVRELDIAYNNLTGNLPECISNFTSLESLDLSSNQLYGKVSALKSLTSLVMLRLSDNYFRVPISLEPFFNLSKLKFFYADNNLMYVESEMQSLVPRFQLNRISLSCCGDVGQFPAFLYHQYDLQLQGQLFSSKFNLTELFELHLDGNYFSGKIPDSLSNCSSLSVLDLSNNQLSGEIPNWMENLSGLTTLDLSNNDISGEIPRWMGNMSNLEDIVMAQNHLEGPFPVEFCNLNLHLKLLDLSMNNISGHVPSCFSPFWISEVHLSRNKLQGPLTNVFRNSSILVTLDLSNNHLTGKIPNWIGNLSQLSYLLLNNNHFEGRIPLLLCNLDRLSLIDLSNNNLSGTIPPCLMITTLAEVSQEFIHYVSAVAEAPSSFSIDSPIQFTSKNNSYSYKRRLLRILSGIDLSCNKLTGEIPHQVENFQNIYALNLSHNHLIGSIPPTFSDLKKIESLDLSHNNLSGTIPPQLVGLYTLSCFSVAYNNLSGSTPEMTAQFSTFEESSYVGNPLLCGKPLPKNCSTSEPPPSSLPKGSTDNDLIDMTAFYASFVASYVVVILSIASVLYINPYWRRAWFYHIGEICKCCYYFLEDHILPK